ncbi:hypothetical protein OG625_04935 [Streptomyces sp. NBC_01351]|uniref:hypothetical protein n=1 Tax=Streptomyces sp. NBC_01351 TaxID=2903833 RepID=UPI002E36D336|nr:hypothetical protein [Streptomyces sp. NBC_01351]
MTETAQQPPPAPEPPALDRPGHTPWPHGVVELRKRRGTGVWYPASAEDRAEDRAAWPAPEPAPHRKATPDGPSEPEGPGGPLDAGP